jgi:hypothetical protein
MNRRWQSIDPLVVLLFCARAAASPASPDAGESLDEIVVTPGLRSMRIVDAPHVAF